ncbi:MAG: hypothetical protein RL660_2266 [Bacteroidota bacterium]|jgi:hypothetical protein
MRFLLIAFCALIFGNTASAQWTFMSGLRMSVSDSKKDYFAISNGSAPADYYYYRTQGFLYNLVAYPKYHFYGGQAPTSKGKRKAPPAKPYSLSIGAPILLGLNLGAFTNISYSAGLSADINVGNCRPTGSANRVGAFAGIGFGVVNTNQLSALEEITQQPNKPSGSFTTYANSTEFNSKHKFRGLSIGPNVHAGGQLDLGRSMIGAAIGYQIGLNNYGKNYTNITLVYQGGFGVGRMFW